MRRQESNRTEPPRDNRGARAPTLSDLMNNGGKGSEGRKKKVLDNERPSLVL